MAPPRPPAAPVTTATRPSKCASSWGFDGGVVFSLVSGALLLRSLWLIVTGQLSESELVMVKESEEANDLAGLARVGACSSCSAPHPCIQEEGVAWVEEPTLQENYRGHASIRGKLTVPIQMGENWCGVDEMMNALDANARDLAMPDAMKIGGVTGWLHAVSLAQVRGIPMSSHIFQEVSAHLMAVTPTAHWLERMDFAGPILDPCSPAGFSGRLRRARR